MTTASNGVRSGTTGFTTAAGSLSPKGCGPFRGQSPPGTVRGWISCDSHALPTGPGPAIGRPPKALPCAGDRPEPGTASSLTTFGFWAFRNGASPVKHEFQHSNFPNRLIVDEFQRLPSDAWSRAGVAVFRNQSWVRFRIARFALLPALRRDRDPGCVRRQAPASVRGRRSGRQRHAWSRTIPECLSEGRARPQRERFG